MDFEQNFPPEQTGNRFENLKNVTPLSRYLAMILFVILPFIGGWVGYKYAPEKIIEVEKAVEIEKTVVDTKVINQEELTDDILNPRTSLWGNWSVDTVSNEIYFEDNKYLVIDAGSVRNVGTPVCTGFIADKNAVYAVSANAHPAVGEPDKLFIIPDADPLTFEADIAQSGNCNEGMVGRDKQYVFYGDKIVIDADPTTYKQDFPNESIKFDDSVVRGIAEGESYLIEGILTLSQDAYSIFLRWEKLIGADQDTFNILKAEIKRSVFKTLVAEDAENYFVDFCVFQKTGDDSQLDQILATIDKNQLFEAIITRT